MEVVDARTTDDVVDADRYPLAEPDGPELRAVVARVRRELRTTGCSVLRDFVRPELRDVLRDESDEVAPLAHYAVQTVNVYNTAPDPTLPGDHPACVAVERGNAFVARDLLPPRYLLQRLYRGPDFQRFVAACVGLPAVHELRDPLSGLCVNVVDPGRSHPWHFDTNDVTVSMLTRAPEAGGIFEYCPGIRSAADERFADVRAVLDGDGEHLIRRLTLRPGDLQLFAGRYALHRVTAVEGAGARHSAIFAYSERPGVVGSLERTRQLFGRTTPVHEAAAARAVRIDGLLD
ncbi:HalD/BesD family halogenase [Patulibacter minatonensis]|uniref:HalD/BesD family halogenase n=1 Tax=Patulibacter minatonensis TaxID=298163 RepID=UPI0004797DB7|nr:hypothetical protein [Patulibacter minatonensis]